MSEQAGRLAIIGRERALIDGVTKALNEVIGGPAPSRRVLAQLRRHRASKIAPVRYGNSFEVQIFDPEGEPTGHIARVTVELDRFERPR